MKKLLMAKARAITTAISRQLADQRSERPTGLFVDDCNRLRDAVAAAYPQLSSLLPPLIQKYRASGGGEYSHQKFSEIDAFVEQLYQLLNELPGE